MVVINRRRLQFDRWLPRLLCLQRTRTWLMLTLVLLTVVTIRLFLGEIKSISHNFVGQKYQPLPVEADSACTPKSRVSLFDMQRNTEFEVHGGHWFHVAEHAVPLHSKLKLGKGTPLDHQNTRYPWGEYAPKDMTSRNRTVVVRVPSQKFFDEMNPFTRMILAVSLAPTPEVREIVILGPENYLRVPPKDKSDVEMATVVSTGKAFRMTTEQPTKDRFMISTSLENSTICARRESTFGIERIKRGHWFPKGRHKEAFDAKVTALCGIEDSVSGPTGGKKRLLLYQRDRNRRMANIQDVTTQLNKTLGETWEISVMTHNSTTPPCELVRTIRQVDVLLTAHGFQSLLVLFMRSNASIFEIYPYRYWKPSYQPLAKELGVRHKFVMSEAFDTVHSLLGTAVSTETCMKYFLCRFIARQTDITMDEDALKEFFAFI